MDKLPYLKDQLQTNIPKLVTLTKRIGQYPETDYVTKQPTGKMQTLYNFTMPDGKTVRHYAKEREEETLKLFNPGETVQVVRQEQMKDDGTRYSFLVWTPPEGAEARSASAPQPSTNTHLEGDRRKLDDHKKAEEKKWADIAASKIIHNFMRDAYAKGLTPEKCGEEALALYNAQQATVAKATLANQGGFQYPTNEDAGLDSSDLPF